MLEKADPNEDGKRTNETKGKVYEAATVPPTVESPGFLPMPGWGGSWYSTFAFPGEHGGLCVRAQG